MRSLVAILTFLFVQRCAALQPHLPSQSLRLLVGNALMPQIFHWRPQASRRKASPRTTRPPHKHGRMFHSDSPTDFDNLQMSHPCTSREYVADAVLRRLSRGSRDDLISDESVNNLLPGCLEVRDMPYRMHAREVPGDGACLFASVAACLWWSAFETHADLNDPAFLDMIGSLRQLAVDTLQDTNVSTLVLEGDEVLPRSSLVNLAAADYNTTPAAYCERMRLPNTWGGGPEIVALSHALRRVIVVYEVHDPSLRSGNSQGSSAHCMHPVCLGQLSSSDGTAQNAPNQTALKVIACLGFPQNVAEEPLHILFTSSAACSTGLRPHAGQTADHFLPLFPAVSRK